MADKLQRCVIDCSKKIGEQVTYIDLTDQEETDFLGKRTAAETAAAAKKVEDDKATILNLKKKVLDLHIQKGKAAELGGNYADMGTDIDAEITDIEAQIAALEA